MMELHYQMEIIHMVKLHSMEITCMVKLSLNGNHSHDVKLDSMEITHMVKLHSIEITCMVKLHSMEITWKSW